MELQKDHLSTSEEEEEETEIKMDDNKKQQQQQQKQKQSTGEEQFYDKESFFKSESEKTVVKNKNKIDSQSVYYIGDEDDDMNMTGNGNGNEIKHGSLKDSSCPELENLKNDENENLKEEYNRKMVIPISKRKIVGHLERRIVNEMVMIEEGNVVKWKNIVFVGTRGVVMAFDRGDEMKIKGNESIIWKTEVSTKIFERIISFYFDVGMELIYVSTGTKKIMCLDANNGTIKWESKVYHYNNTIYSLPEGVYTVGIRHVQKFEKETGKELFHIKVRGGIAGHVASITSDKQFIYVANGRGLKKINRLTDEVVYDKKIKGAKHNITVLLMYDEKYLLMSSKNNLHLIDHRNGTLARRSKIFSFQLFKFDKPLAMILRNQSLLLIAVDRKVIALHPITHEQFYCVSSFKTNFPVRVQSTGKTTIVIPQGLDQCTLGQDSQHVYVGGGGSLQAMNPENGKIIWKTRLPKCEKHFVVFEVNEEENLIFCGCRGFFFALNRTNGELVFMNTLKGFGRGSVYISHLNRYSNTLDRLPAQPFFQSLWIA